MIDVESLLLSISQSIQSTLIGKDKATIEGMTTEQKNTANIYHNTINGTEKYAILDSAVDGKLTFNGLDVGTYYLMETKAPDGFIRDTKVYTITIAATYKEVTYTETIDSKEVSCKANVLETYTVTVNDGSNTVTSEYEPAYNTTCTVMCSPITVCARASG